MGVFKMPKRINDFQLVNHCNRILRKLPEYNELFLYSDIVYSDQGVNSMGMEITWPTNKNKVTILIDRNANSEDGALYMVPGLSKMTGSNCCPQIQLIIQRFIFSLNTNYIY